MSGKSECEVLTDKIESVVKKRDCLNGEIHFKLVYSNNEHSFERCKVVMSLDKRKNLYAVRAVILNCFNSVFLNTYEIILGSSQ